MIPVEKMKRHTLYMGYYKKEGMKALYFFKYMGDASKDHFTMKMYGVLENNQWKHHWINESYAQYVTNFLYEGFEFFEITFEDLATHVIVEVI